MNAQEAVRFVQQVVAWLQPHVEKMLEAPMPHVEVRSRKRTPYKTSMVMNADRDRRHWVIEVYPPVIERWFQRGDYARLLLSLCHELFHPYNLEALRRHVGQDWENLVFDEEPGPLDPNDPFTPYYGWSEGSAEAGGLLLATSLFQDGIGTEYMADVVGRRKMIEANDSLEHHVACTLAYMLEALYRHRVVRHLELSELRLPLQLPQPFVRYYGRDIVKWAKQRLKHGAPNPEYTDTYYVFGHYGLQAIRRKRLSLRQLILIPHTDAHLKELAFG